MSWLIALSVLAMMWSGLHRVVGDLQTESGTGVGVIILFLHQEQYTILSGCVKNWLVGLLGQPVCSTADSGS